MLRTIVWRSNLQGERVDKKRSREAQTYTRKLGGLTRVLTVEGKRCLNCACILKVSVTGFADRRLVVEEATGCH